MANPWDSVPIVDDSGGYSGTVSVQAKAPPTREEMKKYLLDKHGLSSAGADGVLDNINRESKADPLAIGDGGTSFGLFQHHNERAEALGEYASKNSKLASDPFLQLDFAMDETKKQMPSLMKTLQTTKDSGKAEEDFKTIFERPASTSGLGKGSVRFSDYAMNEPRDANTDVHMMSPDDYLDMSPPMDRPWQDKSGQSLLKSLKAGDPIEQIPSLKVDDGGTVTDQDGRHRALAAKDSGLDEIPVAIERPGPKPIPSQMTGMTGKTMATPEARPAQTPNRGIMDWLVPGASAAEPVPGAFKSAPMPQQQATPDQQAPGTAPGALAQQTHIAGRQASTGGSQGESEAPWMQVPLAPEGGVGKNVQTAPDMTRAEQVGTGMLDPMVGAAQAASNFPIRDPINAAMGAMFGPTFGQAPSSPERINQAVQQREQEIQARGGDTGFRTAGQVASPVNLAAGAAMGPMAAGAVSGALMPRADNDTTSFAWNTVLGGAGGKAAGMVGNALSGLAKPALSAAKNLLVREGINLTPGQMAGGVLQRAENALASMPIVGSLIRNAERRGVEDFNRAAINRALAPIGAKLPANIPVGRDALIAAEQTIRNAYDQVIPRMVGQLDAGLHNDLTGVAQLGQSLPGQLRDQLMGIMQHDVLEKFSPGGGVSGRTAQEIGTNLDSLMSAMRRSENPDVRRLGSAVQEIDASLDRMMQRTNPQLAPAKAAIDEAYANFKIVQRAAASQAATDGVFTPAQLSNSVRMRDRSKDKAAYARGAALMQDLSDAAREVLPQKVPDSGTGERSAWMLGLAGLGHFEPNMAIAGGLASLPYTRPGIAAANALAQPAGPVRNALSQIPRAAGQYGAVPAGIAATQLSPQQGQ